MIQSLSHAEVLEYVAKNLVGGDIAGDGGEVVDALVDIQTSVSEGPAVPHYTVRAISLCLVSLVWCYMIFL